MSDEILHIRIEAETLDDLRTFVSQVEIDLGCRAIAVRSETGFAIDGWISDTLLMEARLSHAVSKVIIEVVDNATQTGRLRQKEVGRGDRFASRSAVPRGLGRKI